MSETALPAHTPLNRERLIAPGPVEVVDLTSEPTLWDDVFGDAA